MKKISEKIKLIDHIIHLEWEQFDHVKNEGGRASCQDEWDTFYIMRKSQYLTWTEPLLESFYNDLEEAFEKNWNLITEKYARMMKSTAPQQYEKLKDSLPEIDEKRCQLQEDIIQIQVKWMEDFAEKYPKIAGNSRCIHTFEDDEYNTSYETYLRGEIGTYSDKTLKLYKDFISEIKKEKGNLAYEVLNNTAKFYGYNSVEDAEKNIK